MGDLIASTRDYWHKFRSWVTTFFTAPALAVALIKIFKKSPCEFLSITRRYLENVNMNSPKQFILDAISIDRIIVHIIFFFL